MDPQRDRDRLVRVLGANLSFLLLLLHAMLPSAVRRAAIPQSVRKALPATLTNVLDKGAPIDIHPQVLDALITRKPIVALESTIITHGMPHPTNFETALSVERNVTSTGAVPATIGLIGGRIKYGLKRGELEYLASTTTESVKLSRRDLAAAMALKKDGGTTCSTTLILAALAGIKVCFRPWLCVSFVEEWWRCSPQEGEMLLVIPAADLY